MPESEPLLSIAPKRVACYFCGKTTESAEGWILRRTLEGENAVCPSCLPSVQREAQEEGQDANMFGALGYGIAAAAVGGAAWYGLARLMNSQMVAAAIGIGWLVGKAVVRGAGNKRSTSLQWISGSLAFLAFVAGRYLIINRLIQDWTHSTHWLTITEFVDVYGRSQGVTVLWDLAFSLIAIAVAVILPRPMKLV